MQNKIPCPVIEKHDPFLQESGLQNKDYLDWRTISSTRTNMIGKQVDLNVTSSDEYVPTIDTYIITIY